LTRDSHQLLKESNLNFIGNIEGIELLKGKANVVVTDGFTGNIVIKTVEGVGDPFRDLLRMGQALKVDRDLTGPALVHYAELASMAKQVDYKEVGGGCLLGISGNVILAHGRSNARAIKNAIHLAHRAARSSVVEAIKNGYCISK